MNSNFPYRQVHLDFHTWGNIPDIGKNFSKENFQKAIKTANLDSITVFAKCNMGYCYYPTKVGVMHPNLDFDLTTSMVDAAHEIGVRAPVYINAGLNEEQAAEHPEWFAKRELDGDAKWGDFTLLCLNDGVWAKEVYKLVEEVCERYKNLDGLFLDIVLIDEACYCDECQRGMREMGLDPNVEADAKRYYTLKRKAFMSKCEAILHKHHPEATIFFNSGGADWERPQYHEHSTHYEMEDLPTAWGGYDKLPLRAKFFSKTQKPYLAMTGKFHLNWGEFGGFKTKEALKYEICSMALYGAACSVGDHMHPDGVMDVSTYENIGYAYEYLEKIAPYCYGGEPTARIGLYLTHNTEEGQGISELLLGGQLDFEIVDENFSDFDVVIIPDGVVLEGSELCGLKDYIKNGGKVLFFGDSLIKNGKFQIDVGAEYVGGPEYDCDYIRTTFNGAWELPDSPVLSYYCGNRIAATDGEVVAERLTPYFSRTDEMWCDDRQVPFDKNCNVTAAAVKKGNVIYSTHKLGTVYGKFGSVYHRNYFYNLLELLEVTPTFKIEGIGALGRATMIKQSAQHRYCLNVVYAIPTRRGKAEIIEDVFPIYNVSVKLDIPEKIQKAYLPIKGIELEIISDGNSQSVVLPELCCHETIVFEY